MNIDVVKTTSGNNFCGFGKFLMICTHFTWKVVIGGSITNFRSNHGGIIVHMFTHVTNHFSSVLVVVFFTTRKVDREASVITASITFHIANFIASKLKIRNEIVYMSFQLCFIQMFVIPNSYWIHHLPNPKGEKICYLRQTYLQVLKDS